MSRKEKQFYSKGLKKDKNKWQNKERGKIINNKISRIVLKIHHLLKQNPVIQIPMKRCLELLAKKDQISRGDNLGDNTQNYRNKLNIKYKNLESPKVNFTRTV